MTTTTVQPCDRTTLRDVCAGNCGRRLHSHRKGAPYTPCDEGHPPNDGRGLCPACRAAAKRAGTLATYPRLDTDPPGGPPFTPTDQRWREHAACRDHDPELWFPVATTGTAYHQQVAAAKTVCRACPVTLDCLTEALARIPYGIAAGLTADERREFAQRGRT